MIPIGVGSTGPVAEVVVRDMAMRVPGRCLAAWQGTMRVQGGAAQVPRETSVIWMPPGTEAVYRIVAFDAGAGQIVLQEGRGHAVVGCIAAGIAVNGTAGGNAIP